MALKNDIPFLKESFLNNQTTLNHNKELFEIYEGDLKCKVEAELQRQLSIESYEQAHHRIAPLNVLRKIVDKLSKIYTKGPNREAYLPSGNTPTDSDYELLDYYVSNMRVNTNMNIINELFNLHKTVDIEPFAFEGKPRMRGVPADRALSISTDLVNPLERTHWAKHMGKMNVNTQMTDVWFVYTDSEFLVINEKGDILRDLMAQMGNPEGINSFEKIPAVYVNRSYHNLVPLIDTDMLKMTLLLPVLLSDLNFSVMMQAFSIIYGVDVDTENLKFSPNAFWNFKSDRTSENKPEISMIKPNVDIDQVVRLIQTELSMWLNTKNIKPGSVGQLSQDNMASGVSKMIDEMDTFEDRQKQVDYFKDAEERMWDLIINHLHPVWSAQGLVDETRQFSDGLKVRVEFPVQMPMVDRSTLIKDLALEVTQGFTTQDRAVRKLNPDMTDSEIETLLSELQTARDFLIPPEEPQQEEPKEDEESDDDGSTEN